MFVSIYYKHNLLNAHKMILIVHIFMNVNKLFKPAKEKEKKKEKKKKAYKL